MSKTLQWKNQLVEDVNNLIATEKTQAPWSDSAIMRMLADKYPGLTLWYVQAIRKHLGIPSMYDRRLKGRGSNEG